MAADNSFGLENKVALITGSSRGIGRAIAEDFVEAGASVIVTSRKLVDAQSVANGIIAQGGRAWAYAYNAAERGAASELVEFVSGEVGRLDILVNNAAVLRPHHVVKLSEDEFDEIFAVNTRAAVFLCKACLPMLAASEAGAVVNITAAGAHKPMAGIGAYCASKAAMVNFTSTLAQEWAEKGVRVNALTPGSVATDMILPTDPEKRARFEESMGSQNLMNRLAAPLEIAHAVRFLASPAASFVTGQTLIADGGMLA